MFIYIFRQGTKKDGGSNTVVGKSLVPVSIHLILSWYFL